MMVPHIPPVIASTSVLRPDWETLTWLAFSWSKSSDFDMCLTSTFLLCWFCGTTNKLKHTWFWGSNQEIVVVILRHKSLNHSYRFWDPKHEIRATDFEAKPGGTVPVILRSNHWQTVLVILRPNHLQIVDLDFDAQLRNSHSLSLCARYKQHTVSPDLCFIILVTCHTPVLRNETEASVRVPRMFK
jgi:hypothetical protein